MHPEDKRFDLYSFFSLVLSSGSMSSILVVAACSLETALAQADRAEGSNTINLTRSDTEVHYIVHGESVRTAPLPTSKTRLGSDLPEAAQTGSEAGAANRCGWPQASRRASIVRTQKVS
jgi:hypothetical protein